MDIIHYIVLNLINILKMPNIRVLLIKTQLPLPQLRPLHVYITVLHCDSEGEALFFVFLHHPEDKEWIQMFAFYYQ